VAIVQSDRVSEGDALVEQAWFEPGGVIYVALTLIAIDFFSKEPLQVIQIAPMLNRYVKSYIPMFARSQAGFYKLWQPPEYLLGTQYAFLVSTLTLPLIYAPFYPPIYALSAVFVGIGYWSSKFGLVKWYHKPASLGADMAEQVRSALELILLVHIGAAYLSGLNASFSYPLEPTYASLGLWATYMLLDQFVLGRFELFKAHDELEQDDDAGIKYDDVERKKGYEIARYAAPSLKKVDELKLLLELGARDKISSTTKASFSPQALAAVETCNLVSDQWIDHRASAKLHPEPKPTELV